MKNHVQALDSFVSHVKASRAVSCYRFWVHANIALLRERGFRAVLRERGWKHFAVICFYYLIRDSLLYLVVPYWIAKILME